MLGFVVPLIAVLTYALAANVDECTFGESYWCSSLENAKTCGAIGHCKSTVWKNEILKQDDTETCMFCMVIVKDVEGFVKANKTEQEIMNFLTNVCQMIPTKSIADECQTIVQTYVPEIIELVTSEVDPKVICTLIKLCNSLEDKVSHPHLPVSEVKPQQITKFSPLPIQSEPICTDCQKFFNDIKNLVLANATEQEIETLIDQTLCSYLGSYETMCKDLVKQYLPEIMQLLSSEFDPKMVCQSLGFCTQTMPETRNFLLKMKLMKSKFYSIASADNSAEGCNTCKAIMKDIQDLDRNKAIQTEIKDFFKKEVCDHFGNYKFACNGFVDVYGEALFELLANELDPESRCRSLGFCATDNVIRDPVREATPSRKPVSTPVTRVEASPQCILCEFVMKEIDDLLSKNATEQEIIAALEKVCSIMPSKVRASCDAFVEEYGKAIIDMLVQELDPSVICTTLGLCPSSKSVVLTKLEGGLECTVCETVMQYLEALLEENATISVIESALEKVCNFLPAKFKSECDYVVETYGPLAIKFITTELTPKEICEKVGACSKKMESVTEAKEVKTTQKLLGENECTWGPKYWCTSKENAARCQATDFCEQTGWDL